MQMQDLVKPLEDLTDEELMERLRGVRANRTTLRPGAKKHAKKAAKKGGAGRIKKANSIVSGFTDAQRQQLIAMLKQDKKETSP